MPPLRQISAADVGHLEGGRLKLQQMVIVVSVIEKWAREMD